MPDIFAFVARQRAALMRGEESARAAVGDAYRVAIEDILADMERALSAQEVNPVRLRYLLAELDTAAARLETFAGEAAATIAREQGQQAIAASADARETIRRIAELADLPRPQVAPMDPDAVSNIVGAAGRGTPLEALLKERMVGSGLYGPSVLSLSKSALTTAVVRGAGAREAARDLWRVMGGGQWVAERIARTEIVRAYREASRQTYLENADIVSGWRWLSTHTRRTCAACLAMDGRTFPSSVPFGSHPACRCTALPIVIGAESVSTGNTGEEWLRAQDKATQEEVLTPRGRALWASGQASLSDFVHESYSPQWGVTRRMQVPKERQAPALRFAA